jgi:CHAD domain-containing protein
MVSFDKWLTGIGPDATVLRAAQAALAPRLAAVEHFLKEARQTSGGVKIDAEAVHQLRIWTRRCGAALRLFADVLPRRKAKWLKQTLKSIRRAAGAARDCDVLAARLKRGDLPGLSSKSVHFRQRRKRAQADLAKTCKALLEGEKFGRKCDKLLERLKRRSRSGKGRGGSGSARFGPWFREQLRPLATAFDQQAAGDLSHDEHLHTLRIAGKRLRYALELAPAAIPAAIHRRLYEQMSDLQDRLGHVCDQIVALGQLQEWIDETPSDKSRKELRAVHRKQLAQLAAARKRFLRWWSPVRRTRLARHWRQALRR